MSHESRVTDLPARKRGKEMHQRPAWMLVEQAISEGRIKPGIKYSAEEIVAATGVASIKHYHQQIRFDFIANKSRVRLSVGMDKPKKRGGKVEFVFSIKESRPQNQAA